MGKATFRYLLIIALQQDYDAVVQINLEKEVILLDDRSNQHYVVSENVDPLEKIRQFSVSNITARTSYHGKLNLVMNKYFCKNLKK